MRECGREGEGGAAWAKGAGKEMLLDWARDMTDRVCAARVGPDGAAPPCSFDAAVKTLYDKGGIGAKKSAEMQCAFSLQGWSVDPDPRRDQVFGHPARRLGHSGKLGKGPQIERGRWPQDIQTIIDGTAQRFFKEKAKSAKSME